MDLDVRSRPSRAQLGFLDDYAEPNVQPTPPSRTPIQLTLRTAHGMVTVPVDLVSSTSGREGDPQPTRQRATPSYTSTEWVGTVPEARAQLTRIARRWVSRGPHSPLC